MTIAVNELLSGLSADPIRALQTIVARVDKTQLLNSEDYKVATIVIQKFAKKSLIPLSSPPTGKSWKEDYSHYRIQITTLAHVADHRALEGEVDAEIDRVLSIQTQEPGFAMLSGEEKTQIAAKVEFIRQIIENSDLETKKKNILFKKLNKFAAEVMKDGTDTDTLFAFFGELSLSAGQMAKNAKPAMDEVKDILRIVFRNRAKREGFELPSPEDILQLPGPNE